jgi:hypothetical protein
MKQPCLHLKILLLVFASLLSIHLSAQQFVGALKKLNAEYRQEKVYLHFDRTLYNPGETIWFKAYLFAGNFPSVISKTLYAELLDTKGKVLQQVILPVILSSAAGSIEIPADVSGTVFVRAYTKWMLNFDSSFLYTKAIAVTGPQKAAGNTPGSALAVLRLFPEGGDLVEEVESKVAFKATDHHGMPVDIAGEVLDSKGARVTVFKSVHDGMGTFLFQPKKGEQYKAVWKRQGPTQETRLPAAKQDGIVLETENAGDEIHFIIKHPLSKSPPYPFVYVVAQMHQQLLYRGKASFDKVSAPSGTIPVKDLPAGIIQITVFTPEEEPLAERIVFANSPWAGYAFPTALNLLAGDTIKRGKNTLEIEVPDSLSCNLSVAVTDADLTPVGQNNNIYSSLLLTSDIKGYVHDPAYYFSGDADSLARHLDLVMMTNGWRRFNWTAVLAGQFPDLHYLPGDHISVEGQVQRLNAKLLEGKELNGVMEYKNKGKEFLNMPVQPDGKFGLSGMIFYDTARLFYQFNKDKKKELTSKARFVIRTDLLEGPLHLSPDEFLLTGITRPDTATLIKNKDFVYLRQTSEEAFKKAGLLKAATVIGKKKTKKDLVDEEYTRGAFSDPVSGNKLILPDDDPAFLASKSLLSYLQGRVAGIQVNPDSPEDAITWRGWPTALFVDEVSQQSMSFTKPGKITEDASYILSLSMSEIAMVKIFDPPFFGAWGSGPGGAIAVYLKKPGDMKQAPNASDYSLLRGYTPVKEFYSPDYSTPATTGAPDYRATLYWNPFVLTDKGHRKVSLTFYNNDVTRNMKVIIEGCDEDGKLTRVERVVSGAGK